MKAHLLPKLRCQFAEFLNRSYLKRLGILSPPTCVGFRYGQYNVSTRDFSWKHGIDQLLLARRFAATSRLSVMSLRFYPRVSTYRLEPGYPSPGWPILLRPPLLQQHYIGTGILTCLPSSTAFALDLGTGLPWED
jgi:hypothetical protein